MARIAWISDAGRPTGFARATHEIGERLAGEYGHKIDVLAVGWDAADPFETRLTLHRAEAGPAHHYMGYDRTVSFLRKVEPDVVFILEDPAILLRRLLQNPHDPEQFLRRYRPILAYIPVDGYNLPPDLVSLTKLTNVIAMSAFGQNAFPGSQLVYHGVDPNVFHEATPETPITIRSGDKLTSKAACREAFGLDPDAFIVGRIDTNSGRKDWGATFRVMDTYYGFRGTKGTVGLWHTKRNAPGHGMDLEMLISRGTSKGRGKYVITNADNWPIGDVVALMNCFDVFLTTSRGEGFGLNIAQIMALGIPVIATDCSAITEVVGPGGILTPGDGWMTNPYGVDMKIANVTKMAHALRDLRFDTALREELGAKAKAHVLKMFNWDVAAAQVNGFIQAFTEGKEALVLAQQP